MNKADSFHLFYSRKGKNSKWTNVDRAWADQKLAVEYGGQLTSVFIEIRKGKILKWIKVGKTWPKSVAIQYGRQDICFIESRKMEKIEMDICWQGLNKKEEIIPLFLFWIWICWTYTFSSYVEILTISV